MSGMHAGPTTFEQLRPRLMLLLELHRTAATEEAREALAPLIEDLFLSTAWHVAADMVENGVAPLASARGDRWPRLVLVEPQDQSA
ncbi:MAG: hypothetical protein ACHP84_19695 [Caulobacterales bacterium]